MAFAAMRGARCAGYCSRAEQASSHVRLAPCTAQSSLDRLRTGAAIPAERRPASGNGIFPAQRREALSSRRQGAAQRYRAAAVDSETSGATSVEVIVEDLQLPFGQGVKAVGGAEQLGSWSVENAPALEWQEGHSWTGTLQLQAGEHKFKLVKFAQEGGPWEEWEDGYDRVLQVPGSNGQSLKWICRFSNTAETIISGEESSAAASNGASAHEHTDASSTDDSSATAAAAVPEDDSSEDDSSAADAELAGTEDFTSWSSGNDEEEQHQEQPPPEPMPESEPEPQPVAAAQPEAPVPVAVQGQEIMYKNVKATIEPDGTTTYEFPDDDDYE